MKVTKKRVIIVAFILLLIIIAVGIVTFYLKSNDSITEAEAKEFVVTTYGGTINSIGEKKEEEGDVFKIVFENNTGTYKMELIKKTGKISSLSLQSLKSNVANNGLIEENKAINLIKEQISGDLLTIEETMHNKIAYYSFIVKTDTNEQAYLLNRQTGDITEEAVGESSEYIAQEKAEEIALKEIPGKVSEIELEEDDDFGLVYELEIDTDQNKEVKMYINAYSGVIESINWEED
ncbi:hypothetical protein CEQ21_23410 [Niallia circulans]|uniref:PepSY domain-containing protein n=1 Tax=Niallia circulans TaxID=1397 RepID=A0A553SMY1_NIACI|nr:PepSY domain-containing protein [Niallia circulans]TRZ38351.1 hypothetical protein CEQ21_23410 [Niallia circulans]